jgi:hypothetical protein
MNSRRLLEGTFNPTLNAFQYAGLTSWRTRKITRLKNDPVSLSSSSLLNQESKTLAVEQGDIITSDAKKVQVDLHR